MHGYVVRVISPKGIPLIRFSSVSKRVHHKCRYRRPYFADEVFNESVVSRRHIQIHHPTPYLPI